MSDILDTVLFLALPASDMLEPIWGPYKSTRS